MPIPILAQAISSGISSIPYAWPILKFAPWIILLAALKYYFGGARNTSERLMHSRRVMITGGTSGIGAEVVQGLAARGAQIILLTRQPPSDLFVVEFIDDIRKSTGNQNIFAEQVDLSSLHSVRTFATKWIDNTEPRRLDAIILCGGVAVPASAKKNTIDGIDEEWQVNYLANFHLLSILSPALRAQPAHRDVRVIFTTCSGYIGAKFELERVKRGMTGSFMSKDKKRVITAAPKGIYALSKFSLMNFAYSFQRHLNSIARPDGLPACTRVLVVDPGHSRTPGTRRWMTGGSLWGLMLYLITWPFWWLVLKSPNQGAQSVLYAAMEESYGRGAGGWFIKECREMDVARTDVRDEDVGKRLWEFSEKQIEEAERESALVRAAEKKEKESTKEKETRKETASAKAQTPGSRRNKKTK
ncbi:oxidoreductase C19A8.06 [Penicillium verhagenii]|uniref:oxidoreductase C19A8.06 n=1 Tax=Penicillium verhagenii TaxID=1562060 RepID=UPI002545488F|nr:oxidoreductase C19A8.06 [Penicillium verhagenii]XP_057025637.1 oxidoreductase C19A8.06 [Penicillium verhagenii]KAJ5918954.1 oxidoreductase C19A8.06 [Penicillium verhagenii]KAJ5939821.1 oxidoreductase C19A8.06 [Penicillium verhagenii]